MSVDVKTDPLTELVEARAAWVDARAILAVRDSPGNRTTLALALGRLNAALDQWDHDRHDCGA